MPVARFQMPDGRIARFEVPDGTTPEQAQAMIASSLKEGQDKPQTQRTWGQSIGEGIGNIPSSAANMASSIYGAVTSPVQTARNLIDVAAGGLQNVLPERLVQAVGEEPVSRQKADAVGQFYKQRYGSEEGLKEAVATDPVGVIADAASVLGIGGAAVSKIPGMTGAGQKITSLGRSIDPINLAAKGVSKTASLAGRGLAEITGLQTGAGGQAVREAYKAGAAGGDAGQAFKGAMRGRTDMLDMLDEAKQSVSEMGRQRAAAYKSGMVDVTKDKSILSFQNIDKSLGSAVDSVTFKGKVKAPTAADALSKVQSEVQAWKNLDPKQYHTPEGLDALKQRIGDIRESIPLQETNARRVVGQVYNSIKNEIAMQAPSYAKTMQDYSKATDAIKEIERTLSLGEKAAPDTAIRKLQSVMRNNVNTNYGRRSELARQIDTQGTIIPSIAGQALSEFTPRGIQRMAAAPTAGVAYMVGGGLPAAAGSALLSSPRLVGETAYGLGSIQRGARNVSGLLDPSIDPVWLSNILYQSQQPKEAR
jgi:hypothetical protein